MAVARAQPKWVAGPSLGYAYLMTGVAIGGICVSGVFASIFTPDLVSGYYHEHTPIAAYTGWIFDLAAIAMVVPTAMKGIRAKVTDQAPWTMLGLGAAGIWLAVMFISIFTPVAVTGTDPTRLPIAGMLGAIAGVVLTWLLCKTVKAASFEPEEALPTSQVTTPTMSSEPEAEDAATKLRKLAQLRDSGVITEADFQAKKEELLKRI